MNPPADGSFMGNQWEVLSFAKSAEKPQRSRNRHLIADESDFGNQSRISFAGFKQSGEAASTPAVSARYDRSRADLSESHFESTILNFDLTRQLLEPQTPLKLKSSQTAEVLNENEEPTSLYVDFKQCLAKHDSITEVFDVVDAFQEVCDDHENLLRNCGYDSGEDIEKMLHNEKQTWRLVSCLYKDRLAVNSQDENMNADCIEYMFENEAIEKYFQEDCDIRQAQIVIDWLEENAADELKGDVSKQMKHYAGRVACENTLHTLKQGKQRGLDTSGMIELDPDAPIRSGKHLEDLDIEDEDRLLKCIFSLLRAGKIDLAEDMCVSHGQPWRAASLEGWRLYQDPNMVNSSEDSGARSNVIGNAYRTLWKIACWEMSNNELYGKRERAIYGALTGNLKSMLAVCSSWHDHVWAYFKALVDLSMEQRLGQTPNLRTPWPRDTVKQMMCMPDEYWKQNVDLSDTSLIFQSISSSRDPEIRKNAENPYHLIQKFLIVDDIKSLAEKVTTWLQQDIHPQLLRFIVHLFVYLNSIRVKLDANHYNQIIECYVSKLMVDERLGELVAVYAAFLPKTLQTSLYATFLEKVQEPELKKGYLQQADEAGLDVPAITKMVVERIRSYNNDDVIPATCNDTIIEPGVSRGDQEKIDAIDWLVFDKSQRAEALKQSNAVMRSFLGARNYRSVGEVFEKIPTDSVDVACKEWTTKNRTDRLPDDLNNAIREHLCFKAYLSAQKCFKEWFKHFHSNKPEEHVASDVQPSSMFGSVSISDLVAEEHKLKKYEEEVNQWEEQLKHLCEAAESKILEVLLFPAGWFCDINSDASDSNEDEESATRAHQMRLLRELCVPHLCDLLLNVFTNTKSHVARCMELANVIASEENQIYRLFSEEEGRKMLGRLQEAMVELDEF